MQVQVSEAADGMPIRRGLGGALAVFTLFLPRTRAAWWVLLGAISFTALPIPFPFAFPVYFVGSFFLAGVVATREVQQSRNPSRRMLTAAGRVLLWMLAFYWSTLIIYWVTSFLVLLATSGGSGDGTQVPSSATSGNSALWDLAVSQLMLLVIGWLLLGVPHQAHDLKLYTDGTGDAEDKEGRRDAGELVVGLSVTAACALTGGYIWLVHYSLAANFKTPQLVAGIIFTVALVPIYYHRLARAVLHRGLFEVLSTKPLREGWRRLAIEVEKARAAQARRARAEASRKRAGRDETAERQDPREPVVRFRSALAAATHWLPEGVAALAAVGAFFVWNFGPWWFGFFVFFAVLGPSLAITAWLGKRKDSKRKAGQAADKGSSPAR
jgi:hypothetical protein